MELVARAFTAMFVADFGGALGAAIGKAAPRRLHLMIWIAAGAMLAVTVFEVLPESFVALGWGPGLLATVSGYVMLWAISRYVFDVCPSCALEELQRGPDLAVGRNVLLLMTALGVHSLLDGVGLVAGEGLPGHAHLGLLLGLSLHKLPEGLALTLLLIGAGMSRGRAFALSLVVESFTAIGGGLGLLALHRVEPFWIAAVVANVGGGFLYLIGSTATSARIDHDPQTQKTLYGIGALSFLATSLFLLGMTLFGPH